MTYRTERETTLLKADLHIHTRYSMDCQMELDKIITRCVKLGLTCIAIADHGTAEGALEMQKIAPFKVIVAEEILTTEGEIMGMFLKETIKSEPNARITPREAVKRIREQGALINLQHPFETVRGSALKDAVIEELAGNFDLVEVLNSRSPLPANTDKAKAFAAKNRLPGGAGSDAHSYFEIGAAYVEMPDFSNQAEFLESLAQGKIYGKRSGVFVHLFSGYAKIKGKVMRRIHGNAPPAKKTV
jgi:predicted metal-dependent phosphoesterase TrpH